MIETVSAEPTEPTPTDYVSETRFDDMNLSPETLRAVLEKGYQRPTPVQARAYGPVMAGKDIIVRSKTGTGKTAAFGLPLIDSIPKGERKVRALILCPTRELAIQVAEELAALAKYRDIAVAAIYGGNSMKTQEDALQNGAAIIVGTPGRVYDHIRRKTLKLQDATHAVLDEADEMLNQGFYEEVTRILDCFPKSRQVLLFSATVPTDIQNLIARYTTNAETLLLSGDVYTVDHITHVRYDVRDDFPKPRNLLYMLELEEPDNAIIFCNTRDDTELVTAVLNRNGFDAELLNGDLAQKERERVMGRVKRGDIAFMVATDVAARGIDISDLGHVINYSLPEDPAVYLHRVGRTGRIGKKGVALNLVSGRELGSLTSLEKKYGINFEMRAMPSGDEAMRRWADRHIRELKDAAQGSIYEGFLGLAGQILAREDAPDMLAFLLRTFFRERRKERVVGGEGAAPSAEASTSAPKREAERARPSSSAGGRGPRGKESRMEREWRDDKPRGPREGASQASRSGPSDRELFEKGGSLPAAAPAASSTSEGAPAEARARRPRPERGSAAVRAPAPGQVRLWMNLGKAHGVKQETLSAALESLGAPQGKLEHVELLGTFSYLFVPESDAAGFESLSGKSHESRVLKIERAKR